MFRSLNIRFVDRESFAQEYQRNLANGGIFIPTPETFEPREVIEVELDLQFCERFVTLRAEVVSQAGPSDGDARGQGAAVQFLVPADELRDLLGGIAGIAVAAAPIAPVPRRDTGPRLGAGARISLAVRLEGAGREVRGRTRELATTRVVLWTEGEPIPVGQVVRLTLLHPEGEASLGLGGTVAQHEIRDGRTIALIIDFDQTSTQSATDQLAELRDAARARQLASIRGPLDTLGLPNLLQMFASSAERGTISVLRERDEGRISFEDGTLRHAEIGPIQGMKALVRMMAWEDGDFYFSPTLEPQDPRLEPISIYGAVLEAVTELDELRRLDTASLPPAARLERSAREAPADLDKTATVLLHALEDGATMAALLDAVASSDLEVYRALHTLVEEDLVRVTTDG